ncbi:MAG: hypothetical protein U1E35_02315 [Rhodospirillales bacterium]
MKILEIGPSFSPVVSKSEGWNAWSVDHTDQAGLRAKYDADPSVDVSRIEPVDFVWESGSLDDAVPIEHHGTFDGIASHVIEHIPDPIGFYRSIDKLTRANGVLVLAVPDKRFCFDYFRPLSVSSEFILAHALGRRRHSKKTAFDHTAYTVNMDGAAAWGQHPAGELNFYSTLAAANDLLVTTDESEAAVYVDFHGWCYTPFSFKLVMLELNVLQSLDWKINADFPSEGCEFIVVLGKGRFVFASQTALQEARKALLKGILTDVAEQCRYLDRADAVPAKEPVQAMPTAGDIGLAGQVAALQQQHLELAERLGRQEARLAKIWDTSKIMKRLLRPVRAIARRSRDLRAP